MNRRKPDEETLGLVEKEYLEYFKDFPPATLDVIMKYKVDPATYIAGTMGWLRRGHGTQLIGWSGQGKSVLVEQIACYLASGKDLWGKIKVFRPVKVLLVECENGMDVISRDIKAIMKNLGADERLVRENLVIVHNWKYKDGPFHEFLMYLMLKYEPDVLIIDNFQGHCSGDINSTEVFNEWVAPILSIVKAGNCAFILVDHASKPPKSGNDSHSLDYSLGAYLGSGTGRKANWARTSFELINFASDNRYRLNFSKSGAWAGIKDENGNDVRHFFLEQSGVAEEPFWKLAENQKAVVRVNKKDNELEEFAKMYPKAPDMTHKDWAEHFGVSAKTIQRWVAEIAAKKNGNVVLPKRRKS